MRLLIISISLLISCSLAGQQGCVLFEMDAQQSELQPGVRGIARNRWSVVGLYKHQWTGFEGAPRSQVISVHKPMMSRTLNVGGTIGTHFASPIRLYNMSGDLAYKLKFSDVNLHFGAKLSARIFQANFATLDEAQTDDPSLMENTSAFSPNVGFGAMLSSKDWFVALSSPHMIKTQLTQEEGGGVYQPKFYLSAGYVNILSNAFRYRLGSLVVWDRVSPLFIDINVSALFGGKIWLGVHGGTNQYGFYTHYMINHRLRVGYSVDVLAKRSYTLLGNSHELVMRFDLIDNSKKIFTYRK